MGRESENLLLKDVDVGRALGISRATVWRWVREGQLPKPVRICGSARWKRAELEKLVEGLQ